MTAATARFGGMRKLGKGNVAACCHPSSSNDSRKGEPTASTRKLGTMQSN